MSKIVFVYYWENDYYSHVKRAQGGQLICVHTHYMIKIYMIYALVLKFKVHQDRNPGFRLTNLGETFQVYDSLNIYPFCKNHRSPWKIL